MKKKTKGAGKPAPKNTASRQSKRMAQLNQLAQAQGWKGISEYLTAIINKSVTISTKEEK